MNRIHEIPMLQPLVDNINVMSLLLHNPRMRARLIRRPEDMMEVVMVLAEQNQGPAHQFGAIDREYVALLEAQDVEITDVEQTGSPEAAIVRHQHQDAVMGFEERETPRMSYKDSQPVKYTNHSTGVPSTAGTQYTPKVRTLPLPLPQPTVVDPRAETAGMKIRAVLAECLPERSPTCAPRWDGRLVEAVRDPRGPWGISGISDALAPAVEEFKKELPRLAASLIRNGGTWPAPEDAESLEITHVVARMWARRLVRPILIGMIDEHRKRVAELNGDAKPKWYTHDELDKELKMAKDVHGEYLCNGKETLAKRPRENP